ncbi:MAG: STING domain-containing protein, partial [Alloprevotella sp.]
AIDGILATRNCPIYVTGKGDAGHLGRKYCFYHVLEFLLKVDFDKLFNRYEAYKRRKNRLRITLLATFLTLLLAALSFGWYKQYRATQTEHELAMTEHDLAQFEKETFPFSLVIGYVDNFLSPTLRALQDSLAPRKPHIFVIMPSNYKRLDEQTRKEHFRAWQARLKQDFGFDGFITHEVKIKSRRRASSIVQMRLTKVNTPVFHDFATTVKAIQSVVDYKFDASRHLVQIDTTKMSRDVMVREYSDQFIRQAKQRIGADSVYVHFVYAPEQMLRELQRLQAHK